MSQPLKTFIIYAREDKNLRDEFLKHIKVLEDDALIQVWTDLEIPPGAEWNDRIQEQLEQTRLFLAFVSADFYASSYIQRTELPFADARRQASQADIIPILLEECPWERYRVIKNLQVLPTDGKAVTDLDHWKSRNRAWRVVVDKIAEHAEKVQQQDAATEHKKAEKHQKTTERPQKADDWQPNKSAERATLKDEAAWKAASELDTIEGYEHYDEAYTLHQAEARQRIHDLTVEDTKRKAAQRATEQRQHQTEQAAAAEKKASAEKMRLADLAAEALKANDPFHDLMLPIKGGPFNMGDTFGDSGPEELPVHLVMLSDFHLCKYPVTQAHWKRIMGDNPSNFKGDDLPVEQVSWDDAQAFLKKLNEMLPPGSGQKTYRLPTEAEWEYAAREGGKKVRFGNGKDIADPKEMNFDASAAYKQPYSVIGEYRQKTTPVGAFKPNALGLYDMSGNVWEWCQDTWHDTYAGASDDGSAWEQGGEEAIRVVRGGSWIINPVYCRAARRNWDDSVARFDNCGLRLAR